MANETHNQRGGSGNFANDPERASEAGKKGGQHSHQGSNHEAGTSKAEAGKKGAQQSHQSATGESDKSQDNSSNAHDGKGGNFANDPQRASEAGKKGGENSHGKK